MDSDKDQIIRAKNIAYFFLKFRARTKKEMIDYLSKKSRHYQWNKNIISRVVEELEEEGLIDDKKFIELFTEDRVKSKPKSEYVIKQELMRLGVAKELINQYFCESIIDEEEAAYNALKTRWLRFEKFPKKERFQKSAQFLLRRGFSFDIIRKVIDRM